MLPFHPPPLQPARLHAPACFQKVSLIAFRGGDPKIFNRIRTVREMKFALSQLLYLLRNTLDPLSSENPFCIFAWKGLDHRI